MMDRARISFDLDDEQTAMLDAICTEAGGAVSRPQMAKQLLVAVLEDDAAQHQANGSSDDHRVIVLRDWKGARR